MEWKIIFENYLAALVAFLIYFITMLSQHLVFTKAGDIHKGWLILHCLILFAFFLGATFRISVKLEEAKKADARDIAMFQAVKELAENIQPPPELSGLKSIAQELELSPEQILARLEKGTKLDQGLKAYLERQYDQANRLFLENAKANETEAAQSWFYLGNTSYLKAEYQKASEAFSRSLDLQPKAAVVWYNWGVVLADQGRHKEAIEKFREFIKYKPDHAAAWNNWGVVLYDLDRHKEAIGKFREAIKYKPDHAGAWYNWGVALADQGRHKEAIEKFREAIKYQPDHAAAWYNWGVALADQGRHKEAKDKYKHAEQIRSKTKPPDPDFPTNQ